MKTTIGNAPEGSGKNHPRIRPGNWIGPGILALVFLGLCAISWRKWPDHLVDFGQQLYVPWQISEGKVLYRDLACLYGPLSSYVNALAFVLFGTSVTTLFFVNLAVAVLITVLIYLLFVSATDRLTATVAGLAWLLVFAFANYHAIGGTNFIGPYSHESTHGVALGLLMIFSFSRFAQKPRAWLLALAGLGFGLIFLTKGELWFAALAAGATSFALLLHRPGHPSFPRMLAPFLLAALAPVLAFFLYFLADLGAGGAFRAVNAFWFALLGTPAADNLFYRSMMGLDAPRENLLLMVRISVEMALVVAAVASADLAIKKYFRGYDEVIAVVLAAVLLIILVSAKIEAWRMVPCAFPVFLAGLGPIFFIRAWNAGEDHAAFARALTLTIFCFYALALLAKVILRVHFGHYGFYLALPAGIMVSVFWIGLFPEWIRRLGGSGQLARWTGLALIAVNCWFYVSWSVSNYRAKTLAIGPAGDIILTYPEAITPRGRAAQLALDYLIKETPATASVAVLPEGAILNFWSRRPNPAPYYLLMPVEILSFGEPRILAAFQFSPPDYVVIVHKDTDEFGFGFFGVDPRYGRQIMRWVNGNYENAALIGAEPLKDDNFGIKIMRRRSSDTALKR